MGFDSMNNNIEVKISSLESFANTDFDALIYGLDKQIDLLSSQADKTENELE